jgi:hypothetical protein
MTEAVQSSARSGNKLLIGGAVAAVVVGALALFVVLPAEFGIDPTGVGKSLGLTEMAEPASAELERGSKRTGVLELTESTPPAQSGLNDRWTIDLAPFESIEFKYVVDEPGPIAFSWQGTAPLKYDMHAHPFEGGVALTESYGIDTAQAMQGIYNPAFAGIHGWYWENQTMDNVTIVLDASGAFTASKIFNATGEYDRAVEPPAEGSEES